MNRLLPVRECFIPVGPLSVVPVEIRAETLRYFRQQMMAANAGDNALAVVDALAHSPE